MSKLCPSSRYSNDSLKLHVPKYIKKRSRSQFLYNGTRLWNMMSSNIFKSSELDNERHVIIPGSIKNSDFTSSNSYAHMSKTLLGNTLEVYRLVEKMILGLQDQISRLSIQL
jgi:hypothetical protein